MNTIERESMSRGRMRCEGRFLRPKDRAEWVRGRKSRNESKARKAAHVARRKARKAS